MKFKIIKPLKLIMLTLLALVSCEQELDLPPVDEFAPENALQNKEGLEALLFSAYNANRLGPAGFANEILINEVTTDIGLVRIGGVERAMKPYIDFNWGPFSPEIQGMMWQGRYVAIRNANTLLDNIGQSDVEEDFKRMAIAEARYIRAFEYAYMYKYFGPVPLRTTSDLTVQPKDLGLPTEEEFRTFVETELKEAAIDLVHPAAQPQVGRATKGHAYATLTKFFMNTKQWAKVVEATELLMDLGYYELFPNYRATFFVENEPQNNPANKEIIVTWSMVNEFPYQNTYQNGVFPPGFRRSDNIPEFEWVAGMANWATQFSVRDDFLDSFEPNDSRKTTIIEDYVNAAGDLVNLGTIPDNSRSFKYFDNNQMGNNSGADQPYIRYADILLCRAEALNELNGPTQEAVNLVNEVRNRAGVDPYTLADVGSMDSFRDLILDERGWEFFSEGKRREDLIRHGKFLEFAQQRGINTQQYQVYFPYPQVEVDANSNLEQREGY
ncbi:RagB/SusD family nutrient uptake outer membrane protein [Galbibacter mesophilus]|uniref:RagB/SusD family nutrient uptake outer membrane protein n=1 Tax=Galbibacter mesophilus TaxID=379069 RepID=UPI00191E559B|nr:RagB/SusD family nutrient uptake outer membrane protein [Galbibacter mesophilus]MCM5661801.1 RagB/SusD family nutrient uptake outer membrane protein [Galbibacter mesophilus]